MDTALPPPSAGPPGSLVAPERPVLPPNADPADRWRPWSAIFALLLGIVVPFVALAFILIVGEIITHSTEPTSAENLIGTFIGDAGFVAAALWMASRVAFPRPQQFGLRSPQNRRLAIVLVVAFYIAFLVIAAIWVKALNLAPDDKLPKSLGADESNIALAFVGFLTCVVAPVCEEFLFRGYMFRALRNWRGVVPAALIVGVLFGAVHLGSAQVGYLAPLAVFGVMLCLLYELTTSLYPCIALHCVNNSIAFASLEHARVGVGIAMLAGALLTIAVLLRFAIGRWNTFGRVEPAR
jgi:membrane protease YdiL (CAAX protease family)